MGLATPFPAMSGAVPQGRVRCVDAEGDEEKQNQPKVRRFCKEFCGGDEGGQY